MHIVEKERRQVMNNQELQQIANHLNISVEFIDWARVQYTFKGAEVLLVRVHGKSPRFVSKKVIAVKENNEIDLVQAIAQRLSEANHIPLKGSSKQIAWAESIRTQAIDSIAGDIYLKICTEEQGWEKLKNSSAAWWIDNRSNWLDTSREQERSRVKRTRLLAEKAFYGDK